jgi:hypothetical protein
MTFVTDQIKEWWVGFRIAENGSNERPCPWIARQHEGVIGSTCRRVSRGIGSAVSLAAEKSLLFQSHFVAIGVLVCFAKQAGSCDTLAVTHQHPIEIYEEGRFYFVRLTPHYFRVNQSQAISPY